ncbi:uncharacterized protein LOC106369780 isoform X2 [Brassica napus]|uniref:uncharacterized protein LOC106369780 isoform X2 n=1 Tax=Brassica napus TaxID=3708 RepID=UPI0020786DFC|nr:uncharacterized protein LOC106369780 isoform X2 [Brassica napus]
MDSKIHSNLLFFLGSVDRILECMQRFMSREEIVNHLSVQFQTNPIWTNTVFDNLEHQYPDHFKAYYESLSFAQQSFNPNSQTQIFQGDTGASSSYQLPPEADISNAGDAVIPLQPPLYPVDAAAQNLPGASSFPLEAAISNAIPLQPPRYPVYAAAAQNFPGASSSSQVPPEASNAGDAMIEILKQMLSRLDQMLTKQDQSLTKQDQMLTKQDQMLNLLTRKRERTDQDQDEQVPDPRRQRTSDSPTL